MLGVKGHSQVKRGSEENSLLCVQRVPWFLFLKEGPEKGTVVKSRLYFPLTEVLEGSDDKVLVQVFPLTVRGHVYDY